MRILVTGESRYELQNRAFPNFASVPKGTIIDRDDQLAKLQEAYGSYYGGDHTVFKTYDGFSSGQLKIDEEFISLSAEVDNILSRHEKLNPVSLLENFSGLHISSLIRKLYNLIDFKISELSEYSGKWLIWNISVVNHGPPFRRPKSMTWHFDTHYPLNFPKVHIGFNRFDEHEGGTFFLSETNSKRYVLRTGYSGAPVGTRTESLETGFNRFEVLYKSDFGSYCVFFPNRCLHKGKWPEAGKRKSIFLSLCPFPSTSFTQRSNSDLRFFYTQKIFRYTDNILINDLIVNPSDYPVCIYG